MSGNRADGSPESWVGKAALFTLDGSIYSIKELPLSDQGGMNWIRNIWDIIFRHGKVNYISLSTQTVQAGKQTYRQILLSSIPFHSLLWQRKNGNCCNFESNRRDDLSNRQINDNLAGLELDAGHINLAGHQLRQEGISCCRQPFYSRPYWNEVVRE